MEEKRVEIETCSHCGAKDNILRKRGKNYGLYCAKCGSWLMWYPKKKAEVLLETRLSTSAVGVVSHETEEVEHG